MPATELLGTSGAPFPNPRRLCLVAGITMLAFSTRAQSPGSFRESFNGLGQTRIEPFRSPRWDVAVHVRQRQRWFELEPMLAAHGLDASPPPATHRIDRYEDTVYTAKGHMMTALKAETYGVVYLTPNALADFRTGECVIRFDVSTLRTSRRDWIDIWLTPWEDNMQLPLEEDLPDLQGNPRRGIQLRMETWNTRSGGQPVDWTHFEGSRFDNYTETALPHRVDGYEKFVTPSPRQRETVELRITRTSLKLGMPQYGLWWIDTALTDLGFDRAVVQFGHHSYNPLKNPSAPIGHDPALAGTANPSAMSWHWDNFEITPALRFDIIHADRRFVRSSAPQPVVFDRPAPKGSYLRFAAHGDTEVAFDGGRFQPARRQDGSLEAKGQHDDSFFASYWTPIPEGTRRVDVKTTGRGIWKQYRLETLAKDFAIWSLPVGGVGCPGTANRIPSIDHPAPTIGDPAFGLSLDRARASTPAALLIGITEIEASNCELRLALTGALSVARRTDGAGRAFAPVPLPAEPALVGAPFFSQWVVMDPAGGYVVGGIPLALSPLRRIVLR